jgi:hypothetical protein
MQCHSGSAALKDRETLRNLIHIHSYLNDVTSIDKRQDWLTDWLLGRWDGCIPTSLQQRAACSVQALLVHMKISVMWCDVFFRLVEVTFTEGLVTSIRMIDISFICPPDGDSKYPSSWRHLHQIVWCHVPDNSSVRFNCCVPQSSYYIRSFQCFSHMIGSTYFSSLLHFPVSCLLSISQQIYLSQAIPSTDWVAVLKWVWRNTGWAEVVIMYIFNQSQEFASVTLKQYNCFLLHCVL